MGTWKLDRAADGSVAPFAFQAPTWASFIRFTGNATKKGTYYVEVPDAVRAIETATSPTYRSILGEWGTLDSTGPREWISPPDVGVPADVGEPNDTPETATPLAAATTAQGRVHRGEDVDWYSLTVPADQNSVTFTVGGTPTVGVSLALFDASGTQVPMSFGPGGTGGTIAYAGNVTPGASYTVRVEQPTFSAVFTFDTSGSMGNYLDFVSQAMRTYTSEVVKGEESALVVPFEEKPLLPDWSDEAYLLQDAVNRYPGSGGSSGGEAALFDASEGAGRPRGRPRRADRDRRRDQLLPAQPGAVGRARLGAAAGLRGPCRQRLHARRGTALHAGLGGGRRRSLPVRRLARRHGPCLRPHGHLAAAAGRLQPLVPDAA